MSWISVDTAMPVKATKCLVTDSLEKVIRPALYINDGKEIPWRWWAHPERAMVGVTHWMPFPKRPDEK